MFNICIFLTPTLSKKHFKQYKTVIQRNIENQVSDSNLVTLLIRIGCKKI